MTEFELIDRFFRDTGAARSDVVLGVGDDGALLRPPAGMDLVVVTDTLVEAVHFLPRSPSASIGHRALAVNLSDIAAMGATPAWATLALTLPEAREEFVRGFARGLALLAQEHGVALVGGDTTAGPLSMTVQVIGFVPAGGGLRRGGAAPGDHVCLSGTPGDAAAGLALELAETAPRGLDEAWLRDRFLYPAPRVALGRELLRWASACIDVSDGLHADLGKLATASSCRALVELGELPLSPALIRACGPERALECALGGGDDYELCFTIPAARWREFSAALPAEAHGWRRIGTLAPGSGVELRRGPNVIEFSQPGYDHFARQRS
jgi:thiamine-monophosphate kinase